MFVLMMMMRLQSKYDDTVADDFDDDNDTEDGDEVDVESLELVAPQCDGCCRGCRCQSWLPCRSCTVHRLCSPPNQEMK